MVAGEQQPNPDVIWVRPRVRLRLDPAHVERLIAMLQRRIQEIRLRIQQLRRQIAGESPRD